VSVAHSLWLTSCWSRVDTIAENSSIETSVPIMDSTEGRCLSGFFAEAATRPIALLPEAI
jgi:hypothetical protein